jgi:Flp pilus assembly protein TadB
MTPPGDRPPQHQGSDRPARDNGNGPRESPRRLLAIVALAVVATTMIVLPLLLPRVAMLTTAIVHAGVLAAVLTPLLWYLVYRPFSRHLLERDRLLRLLRESECRFRDIVESAHEWI